MNERKGGALTVVGLVGSSQLWVTYGHEAVRVMVQEARHTNSLVTLIEASPRRAFHLPPESIAWIREADAE